MATVVGDFVSDLSRIHTMVTGSKSPLQQQHSQSSLDASHPSPKRVRSSKDERSSSGSHEPSKAPAAYAQPSPSSTQESTTTVAAAVVPGSTGSAGASKFPSPPSFSSPATSSANPPAANGKAEHMASQHIENVASSTAASATVAPQQTGTPLQQQQQPSPPTDESAAAAARRSNPSSDPTFQSRQAPTGHVIPEDAVIHIRDLAHVQSLARNQTLGTTPAGSTSQDVKYEISQMPIGDVIEMVAALLTKITTTNDLQHDAMQRNVTHQQQANQSHDSSGSSSMSPLSHSVLAFHGKNVPAITILSYLARIHKYCPTTYEVFLSLLVYFDRMTERVNELVVKTESDRRPTPASNGQPFTGTPAEDEHVVVEDDDDLADDDDESMVDTPSGPSRPESRRISMASERHPSHNGPTFLVVDSFNIHRLIIAGVTCASKFFSDVFYTNSRYAKVGGLPLAELNHLELQFLILNDFRLAIPVEDLEAYGTMLVEFYAREVVAKNTVV
ncbi:Putative PHO85 cyclin-7 [[Torrubiella] hemipterigena]|uniref:Putative PHO85 cyclin-7 n=1 Tax=[Torrubiella] hemipterigena TaxID=1531966 RepID=A0A0A1SZ53_9HYPO|nr:Putative PHO85 cyclin-7 [[Torrubiella] hemipterigena]